MKVAVITRHAITNYGSLLQALATSLVLIRTEKGKDVFEKIRSSMKLQEVSYIRYFINTGLTEVRVIYVVSTFIIILHPIIIVYFLKNNKQWKWKVLIWLLIALWGQTVVYTVNIKKGNIMEYRNYRVHDVCWVCS